MIISLYAGGMTVRDIQHHLQRTLGTELSHETFSRITDTVLEEVTGWQARPLEEGRFPLVVANPDGKGFVCRVVGRTGCRWRSSAGYFELIRAGWSGSAAAQAVGVSLSCGSVWFVDAGRVDAIDKPISSRYLNQDDRIEIADGLARGERVTDIAARIGKSYQTVYREIAATASRTGAINRGMRTTRRTCAANAPGLAAS